MTFQKCSHPGCKEGICYTCDVCDKPFCPDHGSAGGDRQVEDVGAVAYPSLCWLHGGFDADA
ncbi:MAG TPA: hypothetical protein VNH19_08525 [Candidatus Limnocylindrales bacterium]|nr:hypothetical protein [Candidatus Limnocylindrales bacterium]